MKNKSIIIAFILLAVLSCTATVAAGNISVFLSGTRIPLTEPEAPFLFEGRVLVPFRPLLEEMDAKVSWDPRDKTITTVLDNTDVKLRVNQPWAIVNNKPMELDVPPLIVGDRAYIPLRFVGEVFGKEVTWDHNTLTASLTTPAPLQREINLQNISIGDSKQWLLNSLGEPNRRDLSKYGFYWYIYNEDYNNYLQVGIKEDRVVALYTNTPVWKSGKGVEFGSARSKVQSSYGDPLPYIAKDQALFCVASDEFHVFLIEDYYATIFYDLIQGDTVTAVLLVDQELEESLHSFYGPSSAELRYAFERQALDLINVVRMQNNKVPLKWHDSVADLARKHSQDMAERNFFAHINPDGKSPSQRIAAAGLLYWSAGENIAMGQPSAIFAHEALFNSPGHRQNILGDFTHLGVGVHLGGENFTYYTQNFYTPR